MVDMSVAERSECGLVSQTSEKGMPLVEVPSGLSRFVEPSHLVFCQGDMFPTDNV